MPTFVQLLCKYFKMKRLFLVLLVFPLSLLAQFQINGIIKDFDSKKTLPFATIKTESDFSTISDVDGKFNFLLTSKPETLIVSYIGYESKTISLINYDSFFSIYLQPKIDLLKEVAISNINPANAIITRVIQERGNNNPQKKLLSFQFKTYTKLVVSANPDSIVGKIDTVFVKAIAKNKTAKIDSSAYKFKKIIDQQHLFLSEKVSQFQFQKPVVKETILGTIILASVITFILQLL